MGLKVRNCEGSTVTLISFTVDLKQFSDLGWEDEYLQSDGAIMSVSVCHLRQTETKNTGTFTVCASKGTSITPNPRKILHRS
jgi:hypothetical protein